MVEFKSVSNDASFPWKIFWATLFLYFVTISLWAFSADLPSVAYAIAAGVSVLVAFALGKFIQKLKFYGTLPPVGISCEGIHIQSGVGLGVLYASWKQVSGIKRMEIKIQNKKHQCIDVRVTYPFVLEEASSTRQRVVWKIVCALGSGRRFRVIDSNLAAGIDALVEAIQPYQSVARDE